MMMTAVAEIAWTDPEIAIRAFLTTLAIPLTYSIANGLAFGFCGYTFIKLLRGRFSQVSWMVYALTALFLVRFYYRATQINCGAGHRGLCPAFARLLLLYDKQVCAGSPFCL
jgi:hypothetical protein